MKKTLFYFLCVLLFFACSKKETMEMAVFAKSNSAQLLSDEKEMIFYVAMRVGHQSEGCEGCVTTGGTPHHVDCKGYGTYCAVSAAITLAADGGEGYYSGIVLNPDEFCNDDFFFMPERSLYIEESKGRFLNIPEQMSYKDEETGTFTFYDIFFSDNQIFENK